MNDKTNNVERWVITKEICEYLAISRQTLRTFIEKRGMPAHKIGGSWRFKISEVDKWVDMISEQELNK